MKKKKALRKAFKIIAAVLILAVICVGTFLAYTWFCEPPCPDEVYYRNSVYIRAKSVDGCGAYFREISLKKALVALEKISRGDYRQHRIPEKFESFVAVKLHAL